MAEVGGAVLSYAVDKLLDEVLKALKLLKNAPKNILKLQNLLERLQQSVKQLCRSVQGKHHPADKWLTELQKQLQKSRDLVEVSSDIHENIIRRYFTSKESLEVYGNIQVLLQQASVHQWASGMSIQHAFSDTDTRILANIRTALARVPGLQNLTDLSTKGSNIRSAISILEQVFGSESSHEASSSATPTDTLPEHSTSDVPTNPQVSFGGEGVANELTNHLLNTECGKWVGLWGMGGIGKTFTARKVFHDTRVQERFSWGTFWLTVSKDQASANHLLKQLFEKIKGPTSHPQLPANLEVAKSYMKSRLDRGKVLLVLDDVWLDQVLEQLDVLPDNKKCVILVTTRDEGTFRKVIKSIKIFKVPQFSPEDSWELFSYHACRGHGAVIPLEVAAVAKKMAEECAGLPLALKVVGSMMADKELLPTEKALVQTALQVWEYALVQLKGANLADNEYDVLCLKLQLSVDSLLEQDSRLQDCFFYFAAFPEDAMVSVQELVMWWIAEGLVQDDLKSSFSTEEEGRVLLGFLAARSMIEVTASGNSCKIHDVLRDLALRNLKWNISKQEEIQVPARRCLYAAGLRKDKLPEEWTVFASPSSAIRLSLRGNDLKRFPEPEQFLAPNLQVLVLSENGSLQSLSPRFFQNLSKLKVLDLSGTGIEEIPSALLRRLNSLVLLNLYGCKQLQEFSNDIDRLQSLEFLDLLGCDSLQKLPRVNSLRKLKRYRANVSSAHDGSRKSWQSCCPWGMQHGHSGGAVPYVLPPNLRQLALFSFGSSPKYLFDVSSLGLLEELHLVGSWRFGMRSILAGVTQCRQLKVLAIQDRYEERHAIQDRYGERLPDLVTLPFLEDLTMISLGDANGVESYGCEGAFPSLKHLQISCEPSMERMFVFHPGTMPKVESLHLSICKREHLPSSITELRTLKFLQLQSDGYLITDEDLESIFMQPDCFPHLEQLIIIGTYKKQSRPTSIKLPEHILGRLMQGILTIRRLHQSVAN